MPSNAMTNRSKFRQSCSNGFLSHEIKLETSSMQACRLPKLPVPKLHDTLEKYLLCVKPLVSETQFEATKKIVENFAKQDGLGEKIQQKLVKYAQTKENWAYNWWLNDMYLDNRVALPVNSNPGMVLPKQSFPDEASRLRYAAKLISGILDFKVILDARALPVDIARGQLAGQSLCMEQYYRLLNSYRLPGYGRDKLVSSGPLPSDEPSHVVVACNNQFFAIDVTVGNYRLTEADFAVQLQKIVNLATCNGAAHVGILTSVDRNEWSEARNRLIQDPVNRASLDKLERCIFVLCLDKATNADDNVTMAHQMLHGNGPEKNSCNRWYDKTIQLVISADGTIGLSYEHSVSEGIAVIALIEHLLNYVSLQESKGLYRSSSTIDLSTPKRLWWNIDDKIAGHIKAAETHARRIVEILDLEIFPFKEYGKEFIKRQNMSPDAYVQVCLQLTYYKLYKHLVSTYESGSTRRFREGRVDNIRAATVQALDFAKSASEIDGEGKIKINARKMLLLRRAVKAQTDFTIAAITGYGIDCHLLGLKNMSEEMGIGTPEIFSDPSYALCNYFHLSTSQIPTNTDSFMCYGAVVPDGYGVSYNPQSDSILFCLSSFRTCPKTDTKKFVAALGESLRLMRSICLQWNRHRSSSLERLVLPRQLSIHRHMNACSSSFEEDNLRENMNSPEEKKEDQLSKKKMFLRQSSLINLRKSRTTASERHSNLPGIEGSPQKKLNRRLSDLAISRPAMNPMDVTSNRMLISTDLMNMLQQSTLLDKQMSRRTPT